MARNKPQPAAGPPTLNARAALEVLEKQIGGGEGLAARGIPDGDAYSSWLSEAKHWVAASFGENSANANEFATAGSSAFTFVANFSAPEIAAARRDALAAQISKLRAFTNILKQTCELQGPQHKDPVMRASHESVSSKKVFVVHGHDDGAKHAAARFLAQLGLEPVILHEQTSGGRTIIEKFEAFSDVAFAVVLLTPDDRAGPASAPYDKQLLRARQNVVLELGYFLGKLGRERVCALYKDGTEIPSDFQGVVFVPMDAAGAWHLTLARELKLVLSGIDLNRVM